MSNIRLLDCTLRDGGYINDWKFGFHITRDIIRKLVESRIDYVEVGFLRDCEFDSDSALFNNCSQIEQFLPPREQRGNTKFTAMALHNRYDADKLEPYDGKTIDAVRVTFHDYDIDEGLEFIKKVKAKGYRTFCNPINIMGYSDEMILELIKKVNIIKPYAFSIVDTFGSMMKSDLQRIYLLLEHNLNRDIVIGLHLHENLGLSYSLAQEFLTMKSAERECVIDASMMGMGRVPGNLCLELIMDYMNRNQGSTYDVNPVLDGIDDHISRLKEIEPWGYNTAYALSAKYNLHRNYAEFLLGKGRLRAKQINQILGSIEEYKKTAYDEGYIEGIYEAFQNRQVDDSQYIVALSNSLRDKNILILAPGKSISDYKEQIEEYISEACPIIFSANFVPEQYDVDYVFFSNPMRFSAVDENLQQNVREKILITSNLFDYKGSDSASQEYDEVLWVLNYAELSLDDKGKSDNCVIMLLRLMDRLGINKVCVAGFDGYSSGNENYVVSYMASQHTKGSEENTRNKNILIDIKKKIKVEFLTPSVYIE